MFVVVAHPHCCYCLAEVVRCVVVLCVVVRCAVVAAVLEVVAAVAAVAVVAATALLPAVSLPLPKSDPTIFVGYFRLSEKKKVKGPPYAIVP